MSSEKITNVLGCGAKQALLLTVLVLLSGPLSTFAQFTKLVDFGSTSDGHLPYSAPVSDGTFLYGMTFEGGTVGFGTIYKIKLDGTGFIKLHDFDGDNGGNPYGSLFFDGTLLYGMTSTGGGNGYGNIFKIMPDGSGFTTVFDFDFFVSGASPHGSLISDGTFLYGMTTSGGTAFGGTVFKIKPDGTSYTKLLEFDGTNNGYSPYGSLISDGTFLYGLTSGGGSFFGTMFKIKTDGTGYTKMVTFNGSSTGTMPFGSLVYDGTFFYGMTFGVFLTSNYGSIFKIKPDGTGFAKILDFNNSVPGATPKGSLAYDGSFLYGMTTDYGGTGRGTIFKVKTDGTGLVKLLDSDIGTNGPSPEGDLIAQGGTLYGVKSGGGAGTAPFLPGAIFKINTNGSAYTKLHTFEVEGSNPVGSLLSDGTFLYGTTTGGGLYDYGTIFKVKPDGTSYTRLLDFLGTANGRSPVGRLISDGTFLYGMTSSGGANDLGLIFKIKPDGTGYVDLLDFDFTNNGASPNGSLIYDGTFLYGMTQSGGANGYGTIFKIKPDGSGYAKLLDFDYFSNGAYPKGSLVGVSGFLYGLASGGGVGGSGGWGTLFKIQTDGTNFAKLIDFDYDNSGSDPEGSLSYDGASTLYGMTSSGGANIDGTIFKVNLDGTGYTKLLDFDGDNTGGFPGGSLLLSGLYAYGMTSGGGTLGNGTLFRIKPDGTGYTKLLDFNDGSYPQSSLITDGTFLYGMTSNGGANGAGILFKSSLTPFVSVTDFIPPDGVEGTYVTIKGNDFDVIPSNNLVKFNGLAAKVVSATATELTAIVPVGATSGPIAVTANSSTGTSVSDFDVTTDAVMINGTIQNCNVQFSAPTGGYIQSHGYDNVVQTFLPVNATDKVKVSFSSFEVGDQLNIYDGIDNTAPLLASLSQSTIPDDIIATGPTGALTFEFVWEDASSDLTAEISCQPPGGPAINISPQPATTTVCSGNTAKFITSASGTSNIKYEWQFASVAAGPFTDISNTAGYSNAKTSTLSVNTTGNFGAGFYRCSVSGDLVSSVFTNIVQLMISSSDCGPAITSTPLSTAIGGTISLDLGPLITTPNSSLDPTSLEIVVPPSSGAPASIDATGRLTIDYAGRSFSGNEQITIKACDTNGNCTTQVFNISVGGDLVVHNGVSPNGNFFKIDNIDALPDTKNNRVYIFDRWENQVWHGANYDNTSVVFNGISDGGSDLPSGVYFYKIEFSSGHKMLTGFISIRR